MPIYRTTPREGSDCLVTRNSSGGGSIQLEHREIGAQHVMYDAFHDFFLDVDVVGVESTQSGTECDLVAREVVDLIAVPGQLVSAHAALRLSSPGRIFTLGPFR
jgi:hypothetical protein